MESLLQRCWGENLFVTKRLKLLKNLALVLFMSSLLQNAFSQTAAVNPPTGGFAIDGNLKANTSVGDWLHGTGTGGFVLNNDGTPVNSGTTGHVTDLYNSSSDDIFSSGSKFNDYISALSWTSSSATSKDDINNGMYHVSSDAFGHQWIMIGGDRAATVGTSFIDFELLQGHVTKNSGGTFTGDGTAGTSGRTDGDIDISMSYTNGGTKPTVTIFRWRKSGSTWFWDSTGSYKETNAFGQTNQNGTVDNSFGAFGSTTYQQFAFVEGAVDVTQLLSSAGNCQGIVIHTIWIKTKASATSTAALKDFMNPIPVNLTFGTASLNLNKTNYCSNDGSNCLSGGSPTGGTYSGTGVIADATCATGYKFDPATSGTGTFTITYSVTLGLGCTSTATATVTVSARPTVSVNSPTKCANDPAVTITATPGSGQGSDYNYAWTVPATATAPGNVQSFSATVAGSYSVVITNKTTGCTSISSGGTLTVNQNPTVTVNSPTKCANDPAVTIAATPGSGVGTDYNYSWTVPAGATAPGNVQSFSATVGGQYSVVITNKTTSCASASGSGTLTVNANPTIVGPAIADVCAGATSASVSYTGTTASPNQYRIDWNAAAETAGLSDIAYTSLPASPFNITIPGTLAVNTYNGTIYVKNTTTGCESTGSAISITVNGNPTASAGSAPTAQCAGVSGNDFSLSGTGTFGTPSWAVQGTSGGAAGSFNSGQTTLNPSVHVTGVGTVTFRLTVTSASCGTQTSDVTVTVNPNPTANAGTAPAAQCAAVGGNDFSLSGSGTFGAPSWSIQASTGAAAGSFNSGQTTLTPSVHVTGVGTVTFRLTITSNQSPSCGTKTSDVVVTVSSTPTTPTVSITEASLCGTGTASLTVTNPQVGVTYTLTQPVAGGISPAPVTYQSGALTFSGLIPGKGYSVTATLGSCSSGTTSCTPPGNVTKASVPQTELATSDATTVKAYPNPFSDKINFVISTPVSGNGSLDVYNMLGQKVRTVYQGFISAGTQTFQMSSQRQQVANLIYVLRIGDKKISGRILQINQ